MKIAQIDMRNNASSCPKGLKQVVPEGSAKRLCAPIKTDAGADSVKFDTHCVNYTKVCGRITGYQYGLTEAFYAYTSAAAISYTSKQNYIQDTLFFVTIERNVKGKYFCISQQNKIITTPYCM